MHKTPDYSAYSLDQLYDVFQHINKEKYPDRFALVLDEIRRKEEQKRTNHPDYVASELEKRQYRLKGVKAAVLGQYGLLFLCGVVAPIYVQVTADGHSDMPMHLLLIPLTFLLFIIGGSGFWLLLWSLRKSINKRVALYCAWYALALALPSAVAGILAVIVLGFVGFHVFSILQAMFIGYVAPFFILKKRANRIEL
jgi:hypothetical protein